MDAAAPAEVALASALLEGDAAAFDRFVELFRSRIFQYSFLMCGQREDAEEVAQETLLKVFEKIGQLREPERVKPWVFRIAKNACRMMRRKSIFAPREEVSLDDSGVQVRDESSAPPDARVLRRELHGQLEDAIRGLPQSYRAVFLLRDVEELSTEETAAILDLKIDAVKTRLHRARRMLRETLSGRERGFEIRDRPRPLGEHVRKDMLARYRKSLEAVGR